MSRSHGESEEGLIALHNHRRNRVHMFVKMSFVCNFRKSNMTHRKVIQFLFKLEFNYLNLKSMNNIFKKEYNFLYAIKRYDNHLPNYY